MRSRATGCLAGGLLLLACPALAAAQDRQKEQTEIRSQEQRQEQQVYGWQLMTPAERQAYQQRMREARTAEERHTIRAEHHERMKARAKKQGVTLPEEPGSWGEGKGMGGGRRGGY